MSQATPIPMQQANEPKVSCTKCRTPNPAGAEECGVCGAHLYVSCGKCDHSNLRSRPRCAKCNSPLRVPGWRRKFGWNELVLAALVLVLAYFLQHYVRRAINAKASVPQGLPTAKGKKF